MSDALAAAAVAPADRQGLRRCIGLGLLAGMTLTAMEMLALPTSLTPGERIDIVRYVFVQWSFVATLLGWLACRAERRWRTPGMALLLVAFALAASFAILGVRMAVDALGLSLGASIYTGRSPMPATFFYNLWVTLFFGGLFLAASVLGIRAERMRDARAFAEIARIRSEALLADARLAALQAHVDPAFLLRVMTEVEARYIRRVGDADRLLQRLVAFLRLAMPGVRGRHVTLADELALAAAYATLWSDLDPGRARIDVHEDEAAAGVPFPSRWLLPVLDRWSDAAPRGACAALVVTRTGDRIELTLQGDAPASGRWIPNALAYRLRVALQRQLGDAWQLVLAPAGTAGTPAFSLAFALPAGANGGAAAVPASDSLPLPAFAGVR
jgi:hypothetical protein